MVAKQKETAEQKLLKMIDSSYRVTTIGLGPLAQENPPSSLKRIAVTPITMISNRCICFLILWFIISNKYLLMFIPQLNTIRINCFDDNIAKFLTFLQKIGHLLVFIFNHS